MCLVSFSKELSHEGNKKLENFNGSPVWAYVQITDGCSHGCSWCYGAFYQHNNQMSFDDFDKLTDKLIALGIKQITISGGEPMEHPKFKEIVELGADKGFVIHVATHGEHINESNYDIFINSVDQVQFNYQGSKHHDNVHKVESYDKQVAGMRALHTLGVDTVAHTTIGRYNLNNVEEIFNEADEIGVKRIRVTDVTGRGLPWKKVDTIEIFDTAKKHAGNLGYNYVHSYDPEYEGDTGVGCVQQSGLFLDIKPNSVIQYCGAVVGDHDIIDLKKDYTPKEVLDAVKAYNKKLSYCGCMAREDENSLSVANL